VKVTYLGTATVLLELGGVRFLTDPAFDAAGTQYDFGPWYAPASWFHSERTYATPLEVAALPAIDAVLVSHDQHADNLDPAGRRLLASAAVPRVITTVPGAKRLARPARKDADRPGDGLGLGDKVRGLAVGESTQVADVTITATPALHGPRGTPQVSEVIGFLLVHGKTRVWISGDTVAHPELATWIAANRGVDAAIVHCGRVSFPRVPVIGRKPFTFDGEQAAAACTAIDAATIVPVHRDGWTHFRQPIDELRAAFDAAQLAPRVRFLDLGASVDVG
jgi:L-ascorbate metabolism protein UlaG (beta-lactamase superfamily)